jgi:hypothetical protein
MSNYKNSYLKLALDINDNIEVIIEEPKVNRYINDSRYIISRYQKIWYNLNYNQVLSCYLSLIYCIYDDILNDDLFSDK